MYTFVKLRNEKHDIDYPWMIACQNSETIKDHAIGYIKPQINKGFSDLIAHAQHGYHLSSDWGNAVLPLMWHGKGVLEASMELELDLLNTKTRMMNEEGGVYLTDGLSYMPYSEDLIVVDTLVKEDISFPHYTKEDIKIKQWPGGKHYYAMVGGLDVQDESGEVKWNTPEMAQSKAELYVEKLK